MKWRFGKAAVCSAVAVVAALLAVPVAAQFGGRATRPEVDLPGGAVRDVIFENCVACHGIDDYAYHALDRAEWHELIDNRHRDERNFGISEEGRETLLDYLVENFGPGSIPFPRDYVPPELAEDDFFSDDDARVFLERTCTSCHELDRIFNARHTEERWRVFVVDMRERGARLEDENLERLVEWLGRVRGTNPVE